MSEAMQTNAAEIPQSAACATPKWVAVCHVDDVPDDGGACVLYRGMQIAVFHLSGRDEWYAVQNRCPHWNELVLWRGMTGEHGSEPKIACPMHKRAFSLATGECLNAEGDAIRIFAVRVAEDGLVWIEAPSDAVVAGELAALQRQARPA
jgi:nitrite reductase (NADH) small subunit